MIYLIIGSIQFSTNAEQKERIFPRVKLVVGILFLLGGFAAIIYNLLDDRNKWMFIAFGVMAGAGVFLLVIRGHIGKSTR